MNVEWSTRLYFILKLLPEEDKRAKQAILGRERFSVLKIADHLFLYQCTGKKLTPERGKS